MEKNNNIQQGLFLFFLKKTRPKRNFIHKMYKEKVIQGKIVNLQIKKEK